MRRKVANGCLRKEDRKAGQVWVYIWRETGPDGKMHQRKQILGKVASMTEDEAVLQANVTRISVHAGKPAIKEGMNMRQLYAHFEREELSNTDRRAYTTVKTYQVFSTYVLDRWNFTRLEDVKTVQVERWLDELKFAPATKLKIRNLMSVMFSHACRWGLADENPIMGKGRGAGVRCSGKRMKTPVILTADEIRRLLQELKGLPLAYTMVFLAASTGLRRSEIAGLKWSDVDFDHGVLNLSRSWFHGHIGKLKTEASRKPVPMSSVLAQVLLGWKQQTPFKAGADWVFASEHFKGKNPAWPDTVLKKTVRPAAVRAGITKDVGWHTFRHTYTTLLKANNEDVKTVQELLRHSNISTTMDIYAQAMPESKRLAQGKVIDMFQTA